jgi:hypothetical protein
MSDSLAVSLHSSGAETASGSGTAVDLYGDDDVTLRAFCKLALVVSAFDATALAVSIQTSSDSNTWSQVGSFATATATGRKEIVIGDCQRYVRAVWTLTGTSATFAVTGTGEATYCRLADLGHANILPSALLTATKIKYLLEATEEVRGRLMARATGPITAVGATVRRATAKMAVVSLMVEEIGLNPQSEAHVALFTERDRAVSYIKDVSAGRAAADFTDSTPSTYEGTGSVSTGTSAGWGSIGVR